MPLLLLVGVHTDWHNRVSVSDESVRKPAADLGRMTTDRIGVGGFDLVCAATIGEWDSNHACVWDQVEERDYRQKRTAKFSRL